MSKNISAFIHQPSNFDNEAKYDSQLYFVCSETVSFNFIAVLTPMAVVANGLVVGSNLEPGNSSLRTPCYILLAGLAFNDFCTGLISQPFLICCKSVDLPGRSSS